MTDAVAELVGALPAGAVMTDPGSLEPYRRDRAQDPGAGMPLAAVLPSSTAEVQETVRWAVRHGIPIVPRGAGTGLSGGATAIDGGIVLCTDRMRGMRIDPATRTAVVQPGLRNAEVKAAVAGLGLWYPPDPASFEICSIGGNVATNAGGLCCVKYGVTTDYVLGLEVVTADGTAVRLGGPRLKDVAGLSMLRLFVGSEGTLGVITEVTLRLLPSPPPAQTVIAWFGSMRDAVLAVADIASRIRPSMLELMDRTSIDAVEDLVGMGLRRDARALIVARSDDQHPAAPEIATMLASFRAHGATEARVATDEQEAERFAHARRVAIPAVEARGTLLLSDVGVAIPRLADLVAGIERIEAERRITIAFIAHAGDGNTHPLVVFDPADPAMRERAYAAYGDIMDVALGLDGTISGEHGVGRLKRPWLEAQLGPDLLELNHRVKAALDPMGIMNPGAVLAVRAAE